MMEKKLNLKSTHASENETLRTLNAFENVSI